MDSLRREFNKLLARKEAAESYFDDMTISGIEKEKHISSYRAIMDRMTAIGVQMRKAGHEMTDAEYTFGFMD